MLETEEHIVGWNLAGINDEPFAASDLFGSSGFQSTLIAPDQYNRPHGADA